MKARVARVDSFGDVPLAGAVPGGLLPPRPHAPSPVPGAVVVHPGAGAPSHGRPVERCAAVARTVRTVRTAGHRGVVTGGPG
ncbi:hypothetical protein ACH4ZX_14030 [Streptomyces sp. NPDC020490]|uniref:hypothetical protein n=1 Tax=Streptomyces sp. NPDC020490 TaxID=3365078 RepID=UPI00379E1F07